MKSTVQIAKRVKRFLTEKGLSPQEQAAMADFGSVESWNNACSSKGLTLDRLLKIIDNYPDIPLDYIIKGTEMRLSSKIGDLPSDVTLPKPKSYTLNDELPTASQKEMEEVEPSEGVPYYDEDFNCGIGGNGGKIYPDYYTKIKGMEKATFFCNASGDSMEPLISNGDVVGLQEVKGSYFPLGEIYAIESFEEDIATIKRIRKGSREDTFLLEPINPDYDAYEIPKSLIDRVYRVVGCIKKF